MSNSSSFALFHRKTLNQAIRNFVFPADLDSRHQVIAQWIATLQQGTLDEMKEVSLHGQFLNDIFQQILGYRSVIQGGGRVWEIHAEQTVSDGGGAADGALGLFTAAENKQGKVKLQGRIIAPIELKGAKNDLDRPAPGRKESAVDQGWRYANYTADCNWVIVSNYWELRLYQTRKTPAYYEQFLLTDLADIERFQQFYFLLCRQNFLPDSGDGQASSRIDRLLQESNQAQEEITKQLYQEYKQVRLDLVDHFSCHKPATAIADWEGAVIEQAQKVLDRILFIAFCEDRGLLPPKTIAKAHDSKDLYNPRPIWENYKPVFRWVDQGNDNPPIPGYNGGLFKHDPLLDDQLQVPDEICTQLKQLTRFDFDTEVSVDILGHIFEQSVTDLEELRSLAAGQAYDPKKGKRKTQGVFYTPAFITQYIVEVALGGYLRRREADLLYDCGLENIPVRATRELKDAEIQFWETYRDQVLLKTKVIDPACGSGAFLVAAFDYLLRQYERVNQALAGLKQGQRSLFDLSKTILNNNLYGVDLSPESVEITKLSLWLKTAEPGKKLTYLDDNIKVGNSIVADSTVARGFDWQTEFAPVFAAGGFDVAIGNPPYVRQELLSPIKPYLQQHYESYDGVADLYTYFYEKGLKILKPGGVLSYIVTNKWLRSGYGEPLRQFFSLNSVVEQLIDFGHAPIFEDADTFPCIITARKPAVQPVPHIKPMAASPVLICPVPREKLAQINLQQYIQQEGYSVPWSRFTENAWSLEPPAVDQLMAKIRQVGIPLKEFAGVKPYRGILTGFNEAFLIDDATKKQLIQADPKSAEIIKPYLRGQDIKRWHSEWQNLWMIFVRWDCPIEDYPSVLAWLEQHKENLDNRPEVRQGRFPWYALSRYGADYWQLFEKPKLMYQEINTFPSYSIDFSGYFINNKVFFLPTNDLFILGCLNSPVGWWMAHRLFPKMIGSAVTPRGDLMIDFPIAPPTDEIRAEVESMVSRLIELTQANQSAYRDVLNWLVSEQTIDKPGQKLEAFASLTRPEFVQELKKRQPKAAGGLSPTALKEIQQVYDDYAPVIQARNAEATRLEHRLSDRVNQAYGLTPDEIDLMWKTAPPRMPISRPLPPI
jgi:type I restriction-modification system DNA methylase subunit